MGSPKTIQMIEHLLRNMARIRQFGLNSQQLKRSYNSVLHSKKRYILAPVPVLLTKDPAFCAYCYSVTRHGHRRPRAVKYIEWKHSSDLVGTEFGDTYGIYPTVIVATKACCKFGRKSLELTGQLSSLIDFETGLLFVCSYLQSSLAMDSIVCMTNPDAITPVFGMERVCRKIFLPQGF